jgi:hypothetical protein
MAAARSRRSSLVKMCPMWLTSGTVVFAALTGYGLTLTPRVRGAGAA